MTAAQYSDPYKFESVTVDNCTYKKKVHAVCGDVVSDPGCSADTQDTCTEGFIKRHNKCVQDCTGGKGFDGTASDTCIDCPTTASQGVFKFNDNNAAGTTCVRCDPATQFFNNKTGGCISINDTNADISKLSKNQMQKCWKRSNDNTDLKNCLGLPPKPKN